MMRATLTLAALCHLATGILPAQAPAAVQREKLLANLESHPYFRLIGFNTYERLGFLFVVERPGVPDEMYVQKVVNHQLPFLNELRRIFEEEYAEPAGLERRRDAALYAIAILKSRGSYDDYAQAVGRHALHDSRAHYNPELKLAVTYENLLGGAGANIEERGAMLHEFMHAMQHAYSKVNGLPRATWFNEGLADYRSGSTNLASSLRNPVPDPQHIGILASVYGNAPATAFPLRDLLSVTSYPEVVENARKRVPQMAEQSAMGLFYAQSDLFVRFLHDHDSGKYLPLFRSWMKGLLEGQDSLRALEAAQGTTDLETLERDWREFLPQYFRTFDSGFPDLPASVKAPPAANARVTPVVVPTALTGFDPKVLALTADEAGELVAAAQLLSSEGNFDEAVELLASVRSDERALRERERIDALIELRDRILRDSIEARRTLEISLPQGVVDARPISWDGAVLRMQIDGDEAEQPLHSIVPGTLLMAGLRMRLFRGADFWLNPYLRWLNGQPYDERPVSQLLRGSGAKTVALADDLDGDFDPSRGKLALWLWRQREAEMPEEAGAAGDALRALRELVRAQKGHELIAARREDLTTYARALAERSFSMADASLLGLHGKASGGGEGPIRVVYDEPADLPGSDFTEEAVWDWKQILPELVFQGAPQIRNSGGRVELIGSGMLNWKLPLRAPLTMELEVEFTGTGQANLLLGVCCEGEKGVIFGTAHGGIFIADAESRIMDQIGEQEGLYANQKYRLRIEHDGETLKFSRDGKQTAFLERVGSRTQGNVALLIHTSNPFVIHSLTIEGDVDVRQSPEFRASYVKAVLEDLWK